MGWHEKSAQRRAIAETMGLGNMSNMELEVVADPAREPMLYAKQDGRVVPPTAQQARQIAELRRRLLDAERAR